MLINLYFNLAKKPEPVGKVTLITKPKQVPNIKKIVVIVTPKKGKPKKAVYKKPKDIKPKTDLLKQIKAQPPLKIKNIRIIIVKEFVFIFLFLDHDIQL